MGQPVGPAWPLYDPAGKQTVRLLGIHTQG